MAEAAVPIVRHSDTDPYYTDGQHMLRFRAHPGQQQMLDSNKRFVLVLAGTQSGKTVSGPWWMLREIIRRGPGDYLVAAPTYRLLDLKCVPEYKRLFTELFPVALMRMAPPLITITAQGEKVLFGKEQPQQTRILFGHATDPESLESATIKAAHLDEAGQKKFKRGSWQAVRRRLSIFLGRCLFTTTPYVLGWMKNELHDKAKAGAADIDLIQFESIMNPAFPKEEFEEMRDTLPEWQFDMMYRGIYSRPAGMIYDVFVDAHKVPRFEIPSDWRRYVGFDFGGTNTAAVCLAQNPETGKFVIYATYHAGSKTMAEHAQEVRKLAGGRIKRAVGGAWSEDQWRREMTTGGGLRVWRPEIKDVEVGISRVYELFKKFELEVFDDLHDLIDDLESYSREADAAGETTEKIEDKETWHRLDALRYIAVHLKKKRGVTVLGSYKTGSV